MPRGRFLSKSISLDERVNSLPDDTARLLFTWLIPHLDCEGRLHGDSITVRSIIFPRRSISTRKVEGYLNAIEKSGLIVRYSVNGNSYLFAPRFRKHQVGLQKNKEAQSQIPPPTPDLLQTYTEKNPPQVKAKVKAKVEVKVKEYTLPDFINKDLWYDFLDMRNKKRSTPTDRAKELLVKKLAEFKTAGQDPNEILERSIMNGWSGIFPPDKGKTVSALPTSDQIKKEFNRG